jgi:hypothetical protein
MTDQYFNQKSNNREQWGNNVNKHRLPNIKKENYQMGRWDWGLLDFGLLSAKPNCGSKFKVNFMFLAVLHSACKRNSAKVRQSTSYLLFPYLGFQNLCYLIFNFFLMFSFNFMVKVVVVY